MSENKTNLMGLNLSVNSDLIAEALCKALDEAIIYGIDAVADHHKKEIGSVCSAQFARNDLN